MYGGSVRPVRTREPGAHLFDALGSHPGALFTRRGQAGAHQPAGAFLMIPDDGPVIQAEQSHPASPGRRSARRGGARARVPSHIRETRVRRRQTAVARRGPRAGAAPVRAPAPPARRRAPRDQLFSCAFRCSVRAPYARSIFHGWADMMLQRPRCFGSVALSSQTSQGRCARRAAASAGSGTGSRRSISSVTAGGLPAGWSAASA